MLFLRDRNIKEILNYYEKSESCYSIIIYHRSWFYSLISRQLSLLASSSNYVTSGQSLFSHQSIVEIIYNYDNIKLSLNNFRIVSTTIVFHSKFLTCAWHEHQLIRSIQWQLTKSNVIILRTVTDVSHFFRWNSSCIIWSSG